MRSAHRRLLIFKNNVIIMKEKKPVSEIVLAFGSGRVQSVDAERKFIQIGSEPLSLELR